MLMATDNDFETALSLSRSKYSKNIIFSYLNINSIRNKFDSVRAAIVKTSWLNATDKRGDPLVYVRSYLP